MPTSRSFYAAVGCEELRENYEDKVVNKENPMSKGSKRTDREVLQEAEELYQQLPRPPRTLTTILDSRTRSVLIPDKARVAQYVLLCRMIDLAESTIELYRNGRRNSAFILTRAIFETTALLFLIYERLERIVETNKLGDIDLFLSRIVAGGKSDSTPEWIPGVPAKAINIGKAIERLDKKFKLKGRGMASDYGFLCDFTHPNSPGGILSYAKWEKKNDILVFWFSVSHKPFPQHLGFGLVCLCMCLDIFNHYYQKMEDVVQGFTNVWGTQRRKAKTPSGQLGERQR